MGCNILYPERSRTQGNICEIFVFSSNGFWNACQKKKNISCDASHVKPKAALFTLMSTSSLTSFCPRSVRLLCPQVIHINAQTGILHQTMHVSPRVHSSHSLSWNWHAFYMLCDPGLMFYEQQPVFHVNVHEPEPALPTGTTQTLHTYC